MDGYSRWHKDDKVAFGLTGEAINIFTDYGDMKSSRVKHHELLQSFSASSQNEIAQSWVTNQLREGETRGKITPKHALFTLSSFKR